MYDDDEDEKNRKLSTAVSVCSGCSRKKTLVTNAAPRARARGRLLE